MRRFFSNFVIFLVALLFVLGVVSPSVAAKETKRVLILYSEEKWPSVHELTEQGLRAVFRESSSFDIQLYVEYLDAGRFHSPGHMSTVADYLRRKYDGTEINAIIPIYPYAADFLVANSPTLFPGVPIIASGVTRSQAEKLEHSPARRFMTGTILGDNIAGVMAAALRMRPATKHVALVAGTAPNDAYSEQVFRQGLRPYAGTLELIDLTKLSMEETLSRVRSLPPDTIVLYTSIFRDGTGKSFVPREALSLIARAANAPVFGLYDAFMGYGIVGGRLASIEHNGREAATLALRILSGESPGAIPFGGEQAYVNLYDWRELKRWGIPETAVPAGGVILYRQHSLWEDHRSGILGALFLVIFEGLLILGLVINLRRRRKAERSLRESKVRITLAASAADLSLWEWDIVRDDIWTTEKGRERAGVDPSERIDFARYLQTLHPDDRESTQRAVRHALEVGGEFIAEYRVMAPDGVARWVAARGQLERDAHSKPLRMRGVSVDVTERKRSEESARNAQEMMAAVFNSVPGLLYLYTEDGRLIQWNRQHEEMTGYTSEELLGFRIQEWFDEKNWAQASEVFAKIFSEGYGETEITLKRKNGEGLPLFATGSRVMIDGKPHMVGIAIDISLRKKAEQELTQQRNQLSHLSRVATLNTLSSSLAHELNQPLGAILRNAEAAEMFLQAPSPDLEEVRAILSDIRKDDQRAGEVIDRMRSQPKGHEGELKLLDLNLLTGEILKLVRPEADSRKISLALKTGSSHPAVRGDRVQLAQVLLNLLLNAMDAVNDSAPDGRRVIVSVQTAGPQVEVAVSDTGRGIPEDNLARVFDPFFTTKPDGLGMGLAISHEIIEAHGGRLWAKNNEGGGATFTITLPAALGGDTK